MAEALLRLGLRVIRIGSPAAVSPSLWPYTMDAAIDAAQQRRGRLTTTAQVTAAIQADTLIAVQALRAADVIVATNSGAADPRLMAACGFQDAETNERSPSAPDGLPPLSLPFVVQDEACHSTEPSSLIPLVSSNTCRSLVLLGDPCQLPPTILSPKASALSLSLMERLATVLPNPCIIPEAEMAEYDTHHLTSLSVQRAQSWMRRRHARTTRARGSILLSVQYRMHPSIAALPSALFYNARLRTPNVLQQRSLPFIFSQLPSGEAELAVRVVDTGGTEQHEGRSRRRKGTSYWNEREAQRVLELLRDVVVARDVASVGVVSPYLGQVQLIKSLMSNDPILQENLASKKPVSIEVKTVDGYQGRVRGDSSACLAIG